MCVCSCLMPNALHVDVFVKNLISYTNSPTAHFRLTHALK